MELFRKRRNKQKNPVSWKQRGIMGFAISALFFLTIGYATVSYDLETTGELAMIAQDKIAITNVTQTSQVGTNSHSSDERYNQTLLSTRIDLDENETSPSVTLDVTVTNLGNTKQIYDGLLYSTGQSDWFYTNTNIIPTESGITKNNTILDAATSGTNNNAITFHLTFNYTGDKSESLWNILSEGNVNIHFTPLREITYAGSISSSTVRSKDGSYSITATNTFTITTKPSSNDLVIKDGDTTLVNGTDYSYDDTTGVVTILDNNIIGDSITIKYTSARQVTLTDSTLPDDISITCNNSTLTSGTDYTYDNSTGIITFLTELTNNITITGTTKTITYDGFGNTIGLPTLVRNISNDTITLNNKPYNIAISKSSGATLTSGTDYTYDNSTGVITFASTLDDSITIKGIYSITYNLNSGTNNASNPATYDSSDLPITLQDATRVGSYAFGGWYETSDFSGTQITSISNRYENITLYAKWESSIKKYSADCLASLIKSEGATNTIKANIDKINSWTIKYKNYERFGSTEANPITSDEWLLIYVGPNTDVNTGPQDGENHIVLMTKYIANNIKYYSSAVTNRSTANTYAANKDNWEMYTLNSNDYAYGTIKSVRSNSSATDIWAEVNYRWYVGFGLFKYSSDDTYSRADYYAFGNNQSISKSGNSEYDSGIGYGTRPMVYLGTDKKISEVEDETYYRIIIEETASTCHPLSSNSTNGVNEIMEFKSEEEY